jgi:putative methanogen marker protein 4
LIRTIKKIAQAKKALIGVGVSINDREYISRTIQAAESAADQNFADILLVGNKREIETYGISSNRIEINDSPTPEKALVELAWQRKVDGIVRGSLSSAKFLQEVKKKFNVSHLFRIALLETASNFCFFFAPIGIDEGNNLAEKVTLVQGGISLLKFVQLENAPIGILSGGRMDDIGRETRVDRTIAEAEELVSIIKQQGLSRNIQHFEILIENAIAAQCRLIIAPDGISGNLIYRTLVHLGNGKSHGAWYYNLARPIIDTSRVAPVIEYESAIAFASALASKSVKSD